MLLAEDIVPEATPLLIGELRAAPSDARVASELAILSCIDFRERSDPAAAWADCVAWTETDSRTQVPQSESMRVWDVLYGAACALRLAEPKVDQGSYEIHRVPRDGHSTKARRTGLIYCIEPGDDGERVMTISLSDET